MTDDTKPIQIQGLPEDVELRVGYANVELGGARTNTSISAGNIEPSIDLARVKRHYFPKPHTGSCLGYVHVEDLYTLMRELGVKFTDTTSEPTDMELVRYLPVIDISDGKMPAYAVGDDWVISRDTVRESLANQRCRVLEYTDESTDKLPTLPISRTFEVNRLIGAGHFVMRGGEWVQVRRNPETTILYHHPDWPTKDDATYGTSFSLKT